MKKKPIRTKEQIIAEAKKLLQEEATKKQEEFIKEYKELCLKFKMELVVVPQMSISPIQINN